MSGRLVEHFGRSRRARDSELLAPVIEDHGDRHNTRIGCARAALADLRRTAAVRDQRPGGPDRFLGDVGGVAQRRAEVGLAGGVYSPPAR